MAGKSIAAGAAALCATVWAVQGYVGSEEPTEKDVAGEPPEATEETGTDAGSRSGWTTAVEPKPLTDEVLRGLDWLVETQRTSGGWAQGEESDQMGQALDAVRDKANVADTCISALALIRSGSTPSAGPYAASLARAVAFVCDQVERSDPDSLYVTDVRGTRVQAKIDPPGFLGHRTSVGWYWVNRVGQEGWGLGKGLLFPSGEPR
ncbi:MAG: hypothetical protein GY711_07030, partial [bacterium]|nr:hypothetical protein [bacterium]